MAAGGGALAFAFEVDDLSSTVAEARQRGVAVRDPEVGTARRASDGATVSWQAAWLDEGPGWRPFFIQYPRPHGERLARRSAQSDPATDWTFGAIVVETPEPEPAATWLARVLGATAAHADGTPTVAVLGCTVRFVVGPRDRVTQIELNGPGGPIGDVLGVTYGRQE